MADSPRKPAFAEAWKAIQANDYFHHEFATYIKNIINHYRKT